MTQMRPGGKVDGMKSGLVKDDFRKQSPIGSTDSTNMEGGVEGFMMTPELSPWKC